MKIYCHSFFVLIKTLIFFTLEKKFYMVFDAFKREEFDFVIRFYFFLGFHGAIIDFPKRNKNFKSTGCKKINLIFDYFKLEMRY